MDSHKISRAPIVSAPESLTETVSVRGHQNAAGAARSSRIRAPTQTRLVNNARFSPLLQVLRRARSRAATGNLLPGGEAGGAYGTRFWHEVARGVPGRTMAECLDGYIASHYASVARFSARGPGRGRTD